VLSSLVAGRPERRHCVSSFPATMSGRPGLMIFDLESIQLRGGEPFGGWLRGPEELREIADGRNDILAEAAGITAGSWYAWPSTHVGYELIGAAMLILAGGGRGFPLDYDEL